MPETISVRSFEEKDAEYIALLARQSLTINRFTNDTEIDQNKASGVYESWTRSIIQNKPQGILIAENDGKPCGMIAITDASTIYADLSVKDKRMGLISLIAVDEKVRGKSIGKALVSTAIEHFQEKGYRVFFANTALQNTGSIMMFQQCGFRLFSMVSEYRCWL
jgi:ribosomal protein S18 acetylase RimI-like enzyme